MTSIGIFNASMIPAAIPPVSPNFAFCNGDYGTGLSHNEALQAASLLPQGTMPITYSIEEPEMNDLVANVSATAYRIPFVEYFGDVTIAADVSGPIELDSIVIVPNDLRGMAAYVADQCIRHKGVGGFITKRIQGLVDFVTDPKSDIDAPRYPDSTAFLTVMVSDHQSVYAFPGDYDPEMALFLRKAEAYALSRVAPLYHIEIARRVVKFAVAGSRMRRMETEVPWWDGGSVQGNRTGTVNLDLTNVTTEEVATARRRRRASVPLR